MAVTLTNSQLSAGLYSAFWNRAPDYTGQQFWVGQLNDGADLVDIADFFYNSDEGLAAYPNWMRAGTPVANAQLITAVYEQVFERAPDADGLEFWTEQLNSGEFTFPEVVIGMMNSAVESAAEGNTDGMQFLNEIQVGIYVAETLRTNDPAITSIALQGVTYEQSSVYIREAQLDEMVDPANTYTLTTSIDVATAQYFDGSLNSFGQQTLQSFDELTGQKTFNVLDAEITNNVTPALLDNIQLVEITNLHESYERTISLVNANDVEAVVNDSSLSDLVFNNVGASTTAVGVENTNAETAVNYISTTGTQEIDLGFLAAGTSANRAGVTIAGVETVNVISEEVKSFVDLKLNAATALTFEGGAAIDVASLSTGGNTIKVASVDASLLTGALTIDMGDQSGVFATTDISITGGQGNDTITVSQLTQDYVVTLGAGNDTVVDANIDNFQTIIGGEGTDTLSSTWDAVQELDTTNGVEGIDVLKLTDALDGTLKLSNVDASINTVTLAATTGALTATGAAITGPAGSLTLNLGSSVGGALGSDVTLTDTGSASTDSLTINNLSYNGVATQVNAFNDNSIISAGYENVALNTGAYSPTTQTVSDIEIQADTAASNVSLTLTGASDVEVAAFVTNSTGLTTIDASGMSVLASRAGLTLGGTSLGALGTQSIVGSAGADDITVGNFASTIVGGTGNDDITGGTKADLIHGDEGNDVLTGAGGNDTVRGGSGNDLIDSTVAGIVSIEGGVGNDTVDLGDTLGLTLATQDVVDGGEGYDTLVVADTTITGTAGVGISNFERLKTTVDQTLTNTVNNTGWTTVFAVDSSVTIDNALSTLTTYQVNDTTNGTDQELNRLTDTATDSLTIQPTIDANATDAEDVEIDIFTAIDEESITIDTSAGAARTGSLTIGTLVADDLTTLTLVGDNSIEITNAVETSDPAVDLELAVVDASAMTAAVTVDASNSVVAVTATGAAAYSNVLTTGAGADLVTGGSADDTLTGNNGADTLVGAAGNDVLLGGQGADSIGAGTGTDSVTAGTGVDTVTLSVDGERDSITQGASDSVAPNVVNLTAGAIAAGDTITFGNGVDIITSFKGGTAASGGDELLVDFANAQTIFGQNGAALTTSGYLSGNYNAATGVFTVTDTTTGAAGADTLIVQTSGGTAIASNTSMVLLQGTKSTTLDNDNFTAVNLLTAAWNGTTAALSVAGTQTGVTSVDATQVALNSVVVNGSLPVTPSTTGAAYSRANIDTVDLSSVSGSSGATVNVSSANTALIGAAGLVSGTTSGTTTLSLADDLTLADAMTLTNVDEITLGSDVDVTLNIAKNALITTAAGTNIVTLSNAGTATGAAQVESYVLANGTNSFTVGSAAQNVTGAAGGDTVNIQGLTSTAIYALAGGTNYVSFSDGANTVGSTISATGGTWYLSGANNASVTVDADQLISISSSDAADGIEGSTLNVTVNTTSGALSSYVLDTSASTWSVGTVGTQQNNSVSLGAVGQNVTFGGGNDTLVVPVALTGGALTGSVNGGGGTDTLSVTGITTVNVSGATLTSVAKLTGDTDAQVVTINNTQFAGFTEIDLGGTGTNTLNLSGAATYDLSGTTYGNGDKTNLAMLTAGSTVIVDAADLATSTDDVVVGSGGATGGTLRINNSTAVNLTGSSNGGAVKNVATLEFQNAAVTLTNANLYDGTPDTDEGFRTITGSGGASSAVVIDVSATGTAGISLLNVAVTGNTLTTFKVADGNTNTVAVNAADLASTTTLTIDTATDLVLNVTGNADLADLATARANSGSLDTVNLNVGDAAGQTYTLTSAFFTAVDSDLAIDGSGSTVNDSAVVVNMATGATAFNAGAFTTADVSSFTINDTALAQTYTVFGQTASRAITTIDLVSGNDVIALTNAALSSTGGTDTSVEVIDFIAGAGANFTKLSLTTTIGVTATPVVTFDDIAAAEGANIAGVTNGTGIFEITGTGVASFVDYASVRTIINTAVGTATDNAVQSFAIYGTGATAGQVGIYNVVFDSTAGDTDRWDLVAIIGNNITADSLVSGNFI